MDFKQIQELIKMINKSNIGELTVEQKDFRITIKQKEEHVTQVVSAPVQTAPVQVSSIQPAPQQQPQAASAAEKPKQQAETSADNFVTIKSPMIGTFYRRSGPDKPAFAEVGEMWLPEKLFALLKP